ncbi:hypothetical protein AQUCO_01300378v1 [Aquilegia coerulea]|uniref:Transmembrane protein 161B n=1 Tax=Aquilegia coerulea TaxID=218851 RepID=A0A2G5E1C1_AQUCA|nr:hypothetical protein AQUCO_01300378v1 [Aquilegia coerulea]
MLLISFFYTYKNLLLHAVLSLTIVFISTLLNLPIRFLQGLHTYILPENVGNDTSKSGVRAAIRRPGTTESEEPKKKNRSKDKFEFDENNAQIFRLQLVDDHLRSRMYFNDYRDVFNYSLIAISNLILHNYYLNVIESSGIWVNGSVIPILFGFIAVCRVVFSIAKVSFERSASKRSEKQLSVILVFLGFTLVFLVGFVISPSVFDFELDSFDGVGKFWIAIFAGLLAGFLFMPAIKSARSFWLGTDQLRWNLSIIPCGGFGRVLLHANLLLAVFASLLWVNPLMAIFINNRNASSSGAIGRIRVNENLIGNTGMDKVSFLKFRVWCLMGSGLLQIITLRPNLQMFLNEAVLSWYQRLHSSKVPDLDFSRAKIFLHNYYLCLAVLQFLVPPALVLLFLGLSQVEGLIDLSNQSCLQHHRLNKPVSHWQEMVKESYQHPF